MKILVIGGTGFISSRLVQHLLDSHEHVTTFTRGITKLQAVKSDKLEQIYGDRRNEAGLKSALRHRTFDVVYDMVAYEPEESQLLAKLFRGKIERFIHCSTISVYMVSNELQCPITEDQDKAPLAEEIFSLNDYLKALCRLLNRQPEFVRVDQETFDRLPFSTHPRGDVFPFNTRRTAIFSLEKIKTETIYWTTPFKEWMPITIDWFTKAFRGHSNGYERRDEELAFIEKWKQSQKQFTAGIEKNNSY